MGFIRFIETTSKFSWSCKFTDGVTIVTDLQDNLCVKLGDGSAPLVRIHRLISNTNYTTGRGRLFPPARTRHHKNPLGELVTCQVQWNQPLPPNQDADPLGQAVLIIARTTCQRTSMCDPERCHRLCPHCGAYQWDAGATVSSSQGHGISTNNTESQNCPHEIQLWSIDLKLTVITMNQFSLAPWKSIPMILAVLSNRSIADN